MRNWSGVVADDDTAVVAIVAPSPPVSRASLAPAPIPAPVPAGPDRPSSDVEAVSVARAALSFFNVI